MSVRKIIRIDEEKCDGCGDCVSACHEGAIAVINGKAKLVSESYCDGLGNCLGECPRGAITVEEREAGEFTAALPALPKVTPAPCPASGIPAFQCPGSAARQLHPNSEITRVEVSDIVPSQLTHWPVQLKLVAPNAPFLQNADILVCADCVPFAMPDFHSAYLKGRVVLVGCPKLDDLNFYFEKLKSIFAVNQPVGITVLKMQVPCCNGIAQAAVQARNESSPDTPIDVITISLEGEVIDHHSLRKSA